MDGNLDGRPPDVQRASQPVDKEGQGSRSPFAHTQEHTRNHLRASHRCPHSLRSSRRAIWKRGLVGPERDRQIRGSSTPAQSARYINPARPPHDANGCTYESIRAHTSARSPVRQAVTIHSEARKRVRRLPTKGSPRPPHIWLTDIQSYHQGARVRPGIRDHTLA